MSWFRQNRFLGAFLIALGLATLLSLYLLLHEKSVAEEADARLESTVTELNRLRGSAPFPNEENLRKMKAQSDNYRASLGALEAKLKSRMFPTPSLQPNEFQALLRQVANSVAERAHAARVQLPENFHLGFDEYATSLPNGEAAPRLGRQLRAIEWLTNTLIDAHVDGLQTLTRTPLPEERAASSSVPAAKGRANPPAKPAAGTLPIVDSTSVDLTFASNPTAARRVFNQIAAAKDQTYVIRTVQVRNQSDTGPKRGAPGEATPAPTPAAKAVAAAQPQEPAISFIVGTEHVNVATRVEIVRFNIPQKETR